MRRLTLVVAAVVLAACVPEPAGTSAPGSATGGGKYSYADDVALPDGRVVECLFWSDEKWFGGEVEYVAGMDCNWDRAGGG